MIMLTSAEYEALIEARDELERIRAQESDVSLGCQLCYIAGPMTGLLELNRPAFEAANTEVIKAGFVPINPIYNGLPETAAWAEHMRADIKMMMNCTAIYMLRGWHDSRGARLEHHIACELGMKIIQQVAI